MKKFIKQNFKDIIGIFLCFITLILLLVFFADRINNRLEKTAQVYLDENVSALSTVFYTKLDDQLVMLESQTRYFRNVDLSDYNLMKRTILSTKGIGAFKTIGVANSFGATMNYNGKSSGNIFLTDYYKTAMSGENAISETTVIDEDGDEVLVLAVPIMRNDTTVGVIYGTFTKEVLNSLIDTMNFAGKSTNVLINKNGTILAKTDENNALPPSAENLFDIVKEARHANSDQNTTYTYRNGGRTFSMVMTPIGAHDWYFATILPDSVVAAQTAAISKDVFTEMAGVVIISALLLFFVLRVMRENDIKKLYLMKKAEIDALTGILNKGAFESYIENKIKTSSIEEMGIFYIIDLDNFKTVNDTFGHEMGDKVLREVSERLRAIFAENDFTGRIGGDEFAAYHIVTAEEKNDVTAAARKYGSALCESIRKTYEMDNKKVCVSVSVGISVYPRTGGDYGGLYRSADKALYDVKDKGKNNFEIYENKPEVTL